jgi:MSHA biogenesis protein MshO
MNRSRQQTGFTLIELVMVIVILGAVGSMASVFMKGPIDAYFASSRRAALTDVADTTVRRMARDIRKALPNSIRLGSITAGVAQCIEFIPTRTGGRYRAQDAVPGDGTGLDFAAPDQSFNMLGRNSDWPVDQRIVANAAAPNLSDRVAVYNLGIPGADAYAGNNTAIISSVVNGTETVVNMAGNTTQFPLASGGNRFHVIPGNEKIVSYVCSAGKLYRNANYAYSPSCPAPTSATPVIANGATCNFSYDPQDMRNALVQLKMAFSSAGETVNIYHEVHVNNTP